MKLKKILSLLLVFTILFITGCNKNNPDTEQNTNLKDIETATNSTEINTENNNKNSNKETFKCTINSKFIEDSDIDINKNLSTTRFCYQRLSDREKLCYEKIRIAISQQRKELYWNNKCCSPSDIDMLMLYISYDYPEYYWYSKENCCVEYSNPDIADKIVLNYEYSRKEVYEINNQLYEFRDNYIKATENLETDYDKAIYSYKYIIDNTVYNNVQANMGYSSFSEIGDKNIIACWNILGVFLNGDAICRGYTLAYQYLMNLQNIECGYVYGDGHCWNIIKLDGDWYYTDVTWGDPTTYTYDETTGETIYTETGIDYSYFCMTTEELLEIHKPDESMNVNLPICTATKDNYFVHNNII